VDEYWVQAALLDFDREKIFHYYPWKQALYNIYGQPISYSKDTPLLELIQSEITRS
jgi:hypothetical protein